MAQSARGTSEAGAAFVQCLIPAQSESFPQGRSLSLPGFCQQASSFLRNWQI